MCHLIFFNSQGSILPKGFYGSNRVLPKPNANSSLRCALRGVYYNGLLLCLARSLGGAIAT